MRARSIASTVLLIDTNGVIPVQLAHILVSVPGIHANERVLLSPPQRLRNSLYVLSEILCPPPAHHAPRLWALITCHSTSCPRESQRTATLGPMPIAAPTQEQVSSSIIASILKWKHPLACWSLIGIHQQSTSITPHPINLSDPLCHQGISFSLVIPSVGRRRVDNYTQHPLDGYLRLQYRPSPTRLRLYPPRIEEQGIKSARSFACLYVYPSSHPSWHAGDSICTTHRHVQRRLMIL